MTSAFFYGTLLHPKILKRVLGHEGSHLQIRPALLLDYTRHKINDADYPGIVPYSESRVMFSRDLEPEERSVRGSLVNGLSDKDIGMLDIFEGNEYTREVVYVHPLGPPVAIDAIEVTGVVFPIPPLNELETAIAVDTYVWCEPLSCLQPTLWMFKEFIEQNAWKWIGPQSQDREDYTEVDRRRDMGGVIDTGARALREA